MNPETCRQLRETHPGIEPVTSRTETYVLPIGHGEETQKPIKNNLKKKVLKFRY